MATTQTTILAAHGVDTPVAGTFTTAATGGELIDDTTYYYRVSALSATGETLAFDEVSQATAADGSDANTITVKWTKSTGAVGYNVYGRTTGAEALIATVGDVAEYTDDGSITPDGALPTANTTGGSPGTSSDVAVDSGANVRIGLFAPTGQPKATARAAIYMDTPGGDIPVAELSQVNPVILLSGPGTFRVKRPALPDAVGIFSEA